MVPNALDMLHQAMPPVLHRRTAMAIEMASDGGWIIFLEDTTYLGKNLGLKKLDHNDNGDDDDNDNNKDDKDDKDNEDDGHSHRGSIPPCDSSGAVDRRPPARRQGGRVQR